MELLHRIFPFGLLFFLEGECRVLRGLDRAQQALVEQSDGRITAQEQRVEQKENVVRHGVQHFVVVVENERRRLGEKEEKVRETVLGVESVVDGSIVVIAGIVIVPVGRLRGFVGELKFDVFAARVDDLQHRTADLLAMLTFGFLGSERQQAEKFDGTLGIAEVLGQFTVGSLANGERGILKVRRMLGERRRE